MAAVKSSTPAGGDKSFRYEKSKTSTIASTSAAKFKASMPTSKQIVPPSPIRTSARSPTVSKSATSPSSRSRFTAYTSSHGQPRQQRNSSSLHSGNINPTPARRSSSSLASVSTATTTSTTLHDSTISTKERSSTTINHNKDTTKSKISNRVRDSIPTTTVGKQYQFPFLFDGNIDGNQPRSSSASSSSSATQAEAAAASTTARFSDSIKAAAAAAVTRRISLSNTPVPVSMTKDFTPSSASSNTRRIHIAPLRLSNSSTGHSGYAASLGSSSLSAFPSSSRTSSSHQQQSAGGFAQLNSSASNAIHSASSISLSSSSSAAFGPTSQPNFLDRSTRSSASYRPAPPASASATTASYGIPVTYSHSSSASASASFLPDRAESGSSTPSASRYQMMQYSSAMSPSGSYRTINGSVQVELPPRRTSDFTVMQIAHPYYPYGRPVAPLPTMASSPPPPSSYNYHLHRSMPVSASVYSMQRSAWPSSTAISMDNRPSYPHSGVTTNGNSMNSSSGGGGQFRMPQSPAFRFPPLPASLAQAGRAFEKDTSLAAANSSAQQAALRASHKRKASVSSGAADGRESARRRSNTAAGFVSPGRRRDSKAMAASEAINEAQEDARVASGSVEGADVPPAVTSSFTIIPKQEPDLLEDSVSGMTAVAGESEHQHQEEDKQEARLEDAIVQLSPSALVLHFHHHRQEADGARVQSSSSGSLAEQDIQAQFIDSRITTAHLPSSRSQAIEYIRALSGTGIPTSLAYQASRRLSAVLEATRDEGDAPRLTAAKGGPESAAFLQEEEEDQSSLSHRTSDSHQQLHPHLRRRALSLPSCALITVDMDTDANNSKRTSHSAAPPNSSNININNQSETARASWTSRSSLASRASNTGVAFHLGPIIGIPSPTTPTESANLQRSFELREEQRRLIEQRRRLASSTPAKSVGDADVQMAGESRDQTGGEITRPSTRTQSIASPAQSRIPILSSSGPASKAAGPSSDRPASRLASRRGHLAQEKVAALSVSTPVHSDTRLPHVPLTAPLPPSNEDQPASARGSHSHSHSLHHRHSGQQASLHRHDAGLPTPRYYVHPHTDHMDTPTGAVEGTSHDLHRRPTSSSIHLQGSSGRLPFLPFASLGAVSSAQASTSATPLLAQSASYRGLPPPSGVQRHHIPPMQSHVQHSAPLAGPNYTSTQQASAGVPALRRTPSGRLVSPPPERPSKAAFMQLFEQMYESMPDTQSLRTQLEGLLHTAEANIGKEVEAERFRRHDWERRMDERFEDFRRTLSGEMLLLEKRIHSVERSVQKSISPVGSKSASRKRSLEDVDSELYSPGSKRRFTTPPELANLVRRVETLEAHASSSSSSSAGSQPSPQQEKTNLPEQAVLPEHEDHTSAWSSKIFRPTSSLRGT